MLMRYRRAALLAAMATLMGTTLWAQEFQAGLKLADCCQKAQACTSKGCCAASCQQAKAGTCKECTASQSSSCCAQKSQCCKSTGCCATGTCCKDGKCCKTCDTKCACCKDSKCDCSKGGECCCKDGKCTCKGKTSVKNTGCPFLNQLAKNTAIIMVMPASLPLLGHACPAPTLGMMPQPPLPMGPQVMLPTPMAPFPPPPPMLAPPGFPPMPGMAPPVMPPQTVAMPASPVPPGYGCPAPMHVVCPPAPDAAVTLSKEKHPCVDTCMQLLDLASELCALMHPKGPSVCASALDMAMMGMCPTQPSAPAAAYLTHPPQYMPPSPVFPAPCEASEVKGHTPHHGTLTLGVGINSKGGLTGSIVASGPPVVVPCGVATPVETAKVRIIPTSSGSDLEMSVGDDTCIRCKKMAVKIGDNEINVSRFDDRVRVRGDNLKATADSVRSDRKNRIILEGDVVMHYKKDGHCANVTGEHIELNLSTGVVSIKPAEKSATRPAVRVEY